MQKKYFILWDEFTIALRLYTVRCFGTAGNKPNRMNQIKNNQRRILNMNMKKLIMIGLAVVCVVIAAVTVTGEKQNVSLETTDAKVQEATRVEGLIVSVGEGHFIMQDKDLGEIQVNLSETTVFEGVEKADLAFGQYVFVDFDGKMTRSLPPQIAGMKVGMYPVSGTVLEIAEDKITIEQENGAGEAIVFLPEGAPELSVGDTVIAYTNGAMTMSLPPQTSAMAIEVVATAE